MRRLFGWKALMGLSVVVTMLAFGVGSASAVNAFHGIAFVKGCDSPTNIGDPYSCSYSILNVVDTAHDNLKVTGLTDQVHAANGDVNSGPLLGSLQLVASGGATCVAPNGDGSNANPYIGASSCTLPFGSSIQSNSFSFYTVQSADFGVQNHQLTDTAALAWNDLCSAPSTNCSTRAQSAGAGSSTTVNKLESSTDTTVHNAAHGGVLVVAAGSTVHDFVTVTGHPGSQNPTGNVTIDWFANGNCTNPAASNSGNVSLSAAGFDQNGAPISTADATGFSKGPLAAGKYSFRATYVGDPTYGGSLGPCEPLTVVDANIQISPLAATNEVGAPHTFTAHVNVNDGTGFAPASNALVTFSIDNGPGALSNGNVSSTSCTTNASGDCTIDLVSSTPGVTTLSAHTTISVLGVSLTRNTDGTGANSGPAQKTWVDANISLTPPTATNEVNNGHLFTAHVNVNTGTGGYVNAPDGTQVTFAIVSGTGSLSGANPCSTVNGECSITVNSASAGVVVLNATTTVSVGNVPLTRSTGDSKPGDSPNAAKTFVDAAIAITPSATNEAGHQHTFTITVVAFPAGATPVTIGAPTVTFSPTDPATVGPVQFVSLVGNVATYTVTINNPTAGVFTANASDMVTMGGVQVTRSTSGNSGPGGSGAATKTYVDASIALSPLTATNEVNQHHIVTATVKKDPGTGPVNAVGAPVVFTVSGDTANLTYTDPNTDGDNNPLTALTDANGKATLEFTKSGAGSVTVNASTTLSVGGLTLTRDTDPATGATAGPGGTGPAGKTFVDANIALSPLTATNEVNQHHTVTATVKKDPGTGLVVAAGAPVVFTVTGNTANLTYFDANADGDNNPLTATTDANGKATLEFTKSGAGSVTVNASTTVSVGGLSLTRDTDPATPATAGPGGTGPAGKTFVDAAISITPNTATNEVGNSHTFTITVTAIPAGATPVSIDIPTVSFSPVPGTVGPVTFVSLVGNVATYTVTINSSTPGTFTANASDTVTMGGVTVTRDTNPATPATSGPGGSGPATKAYVDANITLTPLTATNEVNHGHLFTAHVNINAGDGNGYVNAPDGTQVSFAIVNGTGSLSGSNPCSTVNGECAITVNSAQAGTVTLNASTTLQVGGVTLTRSTGDAHAGDSLNAQKTFVDANIQITPQTADNPVGTTHELTVHVGVNPGTGPADAANGTVVSLTLTNSGGATATFTTGPGAGTAATTCTVAGGNGICKATISSPTSGSTTVTATTTVNVGGVLLTRTTGDGLPGDSPPANKNWINTNTSTATNQEYIPQDSATVTGFGTPTGTVKFELFQDSSNCSGSPVYTQTVNLSGGSGSTTNSGIPAQNGGFTATGNHTWYWKVTYSGDGNNNPSNSCVESSQIQE